MTTVCSHRLPGGGPLPRVLLSALFVCYTHYGKGLKLALATLREFFIRTLRYKIIVIQRIGI